MGKRIFYFFIFFHFLSLFSIISREAEGVKEIQLLPWQPLAGHLPHLSSCTVCFLPVPGPGFRAEEFSYWGWQRESVYAKQ